MNQVVRCMIHKKAKDPANHKNNCDQIKDASHDNLIILDLHESKDYAKVSSTYTASDSCFKCSAEAKGNEIVNKVPTPSEDATSIEALCP